MEKNAEINVANIVRIGTVTAVNPSKRQARVKFKDSDLTSGWLSVLQHYGSGVSVADDGKHEHEVDTGGIAKEVEDHDHKGSCVTYWMPRLDDIVLVLYLPVFQGDGYIVGGI